MNSNAFSYTEIFMQETHSKFSLNSVFDFLCIDNETHAGLPLEYLKG